ncbi:MAG: hydrogenase iron-sulfur subunit [bacterium]
MKPSSRKKGASRRKAGAAGTAGSRKRARMARGRSGKTDVVALACKWHPVESMENAVADGFTLPAGVVVLPVRCTGGITVASILKLFAKGLEGVLIMGCNEGDCHYYNGSERCREIIKDTREILGWSGIAPERLGFALMSGSQGKNFEEVLGDYLKELKKAKAGRAGSGRRKRVA